MPLQAGALRAPPLLLRPWDPRTDAGAVLEAAAHGLLDLDDPLLPAPEAAADLVRAARRWCATGTAWLGPQVHWALTREGEPAGAVGGVVVHAIDEAAASAELGYWLLPPARGHGWAGVAVRAVADVAAEAGLVDLRVRHAAGNPASCRTAERAGFVLSSVEPDGGHEHRRPPPARA